MTEYEHANEPPAPPSEDPILSAIEPKTPVEGTISFRHWAQGKKKPMAAAVRVKLGILRKEIDKKFEPSKLEAAFNELMGAK